MAGRSGEVLQEGQQGSGAFTEGRVGGVGLGDPPGGPEGVERTSWMVGRGCDFPRRAKR